MDVGNSLTVVREVQTRLKAAVLARGARPLRFAIVGGATGVAQLSVLAVLVWMGMQPLLAELIAFAFSIQMSFVLSQTFTWRDRYGAESGKRNIAVRWAAFHACISAGAAVNLAVFAVSMHSLPHMLAAVMGIVAGASLNFLTNDRLIFGRGSTTNQVASATGPADLVAPHTV
jgi:putative flippase GtrA